MDIGQFRHALGYLGCVLITIFMVYVPTVAIKKGVIRNYRYYPSVIYRNRSPLLFWMLVLLCYGFALLLTVTGLWALALYLAGR